MYLPRAWRLAILQTEALHLAWDLDVIENVLICFPAVFKPGGSSMGTSAYQSDRLSGKPRQYCGEDSM